MRAQARHGFAPPALASPDRAAAPAPSAEETLEAKFAAERADPTWASATRQELDADLGRFASSDANVRTVECRATLCRVELAVANREAGSAMLQAWLPERTFAGPGHVAKGAGGDTTLVMYVGRAGTDLPVP